MKSKIKKAKLKRKKRRKKEISDEAVTKLAKQLLKTLEKEKREDVIDKTKRVLNYPGVKEVLVFLGMGSFLVLSAAIPSIPVIVKSILDERSSDDWKKYNQWYLRRTLKRLKKQKMIDFDIEGDKMVVKLSNRGKKKILKYSLENLEIKRPKIWDRKWRLIIYDVPNERRKSANDFSRMLEDLGMHRLQKSVFLSPFPCQDEVEFLREFFGISEHVWILTVTSFENDQVFKDYFRI
jgi:hypothetical protein